jgi:hypothetical protein
MTTTPSTEDPSDKPDSSRHDEAALESLAGRLVDLFVFAPAGAALTLAEEIPKFVEKGRNRIEGQTATARMIGQFVVQIGRREIETRAKNLLGSQKTAPKTAQKTAQKPAEKKPAQKTADKPAQKPADSAPRERTSPPRATHRPAASAVAQTSAAAPSVSSPAPAAPTTPSATPENVSGNGWVHPSDLAIPAYDTLSASQVVKRLDGLSRGEHERTNRRRATILNKVDQLLSGESSTGTN